MKNNKKLIIIGASGHGKVVADIAIKMGLWEQIHFMDKDERITFVLGIKNIGEINFREHIKDSDFVVAIGDHKTRKKILAQLEDEGAEIAILVHPNAVIGEDVDLGVGTVVMAGAVINSGSTIGKGCIINTGATIDHDCVLNDYVHISPGANLGGTVSVGENTWIGIGSAINNNVNITNDCMVGAGAAVVKDITEPGTYVGVPVRKIAK